MTAPLTARADVLTEGIPRASLLPDIVRGMTAHLTARADVPDRGAGPLRQAARLPPRPPAEWTTEGGTSTAQIGEATAVVLVGDGVLTLLAQAPDEESLERVKHVLGSHLERFGQRNELTVTWEVGAGN